MPATRPATITLTYLQRAQGLSGEALARRRTALRVRHGELLRRHAADDCTRTGWLAEADLDKLPLVEPVYPLTEGLGLNVVRKAAEAALAQNAGAAGMAGRSLAEAAEMARLRRGVVGTASPGRPRRGRARNVWLVAARLRRIARGPIGARAGAREPEASRRPAEQRRRTARAARSPPRCPTR